jgi:cellulose biosynthesis protein BcsQ
LSHIPNSTYDALLKLGSDYDFIILDLSPALSATNQLFLMLSDYFIIPVNPSIFSQQALSNLGEIFRDWNRELSGFEIFRRKVKALPKLLGIVCQNYRPYSRKGEENTKSAMRFESRMKYLNDSAIELATDLSGFKLALTKSEFSDIFKNSTPYRIANIPDYNQLAIVSESEKIPVNGFDNKILNKHGINQEDYRRKVEDFKVECSKIIEGILRVVV